MFTDEFPSNVVNGDCQLSEIDGNVPVSTRRAVYHLLKASSYAEDTRRNAWEFAVTIGELRRDGLSESELRWLVCRGLIEHAKEVATTGNERKFDREVSLRFGKRSAFIITDAGVTFSHELLKEFTSYEVADGVEPDGFDATPPLRKLQTIDEAHQGANGKMLPKWDRDRRELRLESKVVKVFKLPSPMQEAILMAFEEENWPPRIDDPLPGHPDLLPKRRLHDTIKSLNRNQKNCLIRFMGDGTGEGIRWELNTSADGAEHSKLPPK